MKITPPPLNTILLIAIAVLLTLQIQSWFGRSGKPNSYYKEKIADMDKEIQSIRSEREDTRRRYDSIILIQMQKDTVLIREYKTNTIKYEKIPVTVSNYSNDELRRAIYNY
jgi:FlaG/FlaF family flagellin (archaellin)